MTTNNKKKTICALSHKGVHRAEKKWVKRIAMVLMVAYTDPGVQLSPAVTLIF